jgi:sigma-B regulation protein RsbU (phosphoserine phosphatase)
MESGKNSPEKVAAQPGAGDADPASRLDELQEKVRLLEAALEKERAQHRKIEDALKMSRLIVEKSPVVLFRRTAGQELQLEYISENISRFGYSPKEFLTGERSFREILHPDDMERVTREVHEYADKDVEEYVQTYRCLTKDGEVRWVEDQTSVVRDENGNKTHNQGILIDITERKSAEESLRKSEEKFRRIVETAAEGFILMDENFRISDVNETYCRMTGYGREELLGKSPFELTTEPFRHFLQSRKETLLAQERREFECSLVARDGRAIPVLAHGNTLRDDSGRVIGNMAFITDMTEQKKALTLAAEVQKSLLPHEKPFVPGLDIAGKNISCDEIGGDYFDFFPHTRKGDELFRVVVGDISGHGLDSALLMTTARAFLRMRASQPGTCAEVISAMNRHLARDVLDSGHFMTLFFMEIAPRQKWIEWVRAGHDPALVYDPAADSFTELMGEGIALGISENYEYTACRHENLMDGQIITIGTDGIWEALNMRGEMFGKKRFQDAIRDSAAEGASEILDRVYEELNHFTAGRKTDDDITLVIVKLGGLG